MLEVESSVTDSNWQREFLRSPCQHMASRPPLFIKFGPWIDHGESISEGKFFLRVHRPFKTDATISGDTERSNYLIHVFVDLLNALLSF